MEERLSCQIRRLQVCVLALLLATVLLGINCVHPLLPRQRFKVLEAERINIREKSGILKAALSNSAGFNEFQRAERGGVTFSGLMFYNEEGKEEGGLVYSGKSAPGGQDADVTLTMDQYRQDQNVYLHHEEHKDSQHLSIEDGLSINARPDWTGVKEEYGIYDQLDKLPPEQQEEARLKARQAGKISSPGRVFLGVRRGLRDSVPYDDSGVFIKNKWGRNAIKLYVDNENKPHFEVYDALGKSIIYELKVPAQ
jgi:hypothetical protein